MVTYEFYRDVYLGSRLEESDFQKEAARADRWVARLERLYLVSPVGEDGRDMAVCAVAEAMDRYRNSLGVTQATVGGVSVRYDTAGVQKHLRRAAEVFLDIRRGVG